ncbi:uncharacterized protein LOC135922248 [Gordionus sp. m RMFG-2023]|uniref:uncharacterized protein LOC135922248 n=1 Tax=Gordionus sp. m RMFG-2023 TaxID=3053472 RepID=UPI0031FBE76C
MSKLWIHHKKTPSFICRDILYLTCELSHQELLRLMIKMSNDDDVTLNLILSFSQQSSLTIFLYFQSPNNYCPKTISLLFLSYVNSWTSVLHKKRHNEHIFIGNTPTHNDFNSFFFNLTNNIKSLTKFLLAPEFLNKVNSTFFHQHYIIPLVACLSKLISGLCRRFRELSFQSDSEKRIKSTLFPEWLINMCEACYIVYADNSINPDKDDFEVKDEGKEIRLKNKGSKKQYEVENYKFVSYKMIRNSLMDIMGVLDKNGLVYARQRLVIGKNMENIDEKRSIYSISYDAGKNMSGKYEKEQTVALFAERLFDAFEKHHRYKGKN